MFESFKWVNNAGQVCIFFALLGEKKKKYAFCMALKICNGKCGVNIYQLKKLTISLGCLFFIIHTIKILNNIDNICR